MNRHEFLDILKQYLTGQVDSEVINQNIRYYDQYITSQTNEEQAIQTLGDPRLIAKTIIETDKISKQKNGDTGKHYYNGNTGTHYNEQHSEQEKESQFGRNHNGVFNLLFTNFNWYHKLVLTIVLILTVVIVIYIGSIIIRFLFAFIIPILIILLLISLFRKR